MTHSNDIKIIKQAIIQAAQQLYNKNLLAACDGNISYRMSDDLILITPKGRPKNALTQDDFAIIDINNRIITGEPSSERLMHLKVYQHCPQAKCVVHAHPPTAIAWTIADPTLTELPNTCLSELIIAAGHIPIAPFAVPGTDDMGDVLVPFLKQRIIILARHGALCWGESVSEAANAMERLEHTADTLMRAKLLGGLTSLSQHHIDELYKIRASIGDKVI